MKYNIIYIIAFILIILVSCKEKPKVSETEATGRNITHHASEGARTSVEKAVAAFNVAMVNPEVDKLSSLCADSLSYGHSSGLIQNKSEFVDDVVNGAFDFLSIQNPDQKIILSGNTATVRHIFKADALKDGDTLHIEIGNLQVYQKDSLGSWKLLARQAFKL